MIRLSQVVAEVESHDNGATLRFEKASFEANGCKSDIIRAIVARNFYCSPETAGMIYWTSWGTYQLMGFNLYGPVIDYPASVFSFWTSRVQHEIQFQAFIKSGGYDNDDFSTWSADRVNAFARFYNGPGNVDVYAGRLLDAFNKLKGTNP